MRELEQRYPDAVAVVGVHSGKYHAERDTARIRDASLRLGATHPVVNDRQFRVWRSYAVNAWPTLVAIDPRGYVVGHHAGEFTAEMLSPFVDRVLARPDPSGAPELQHWSADAPSIAPGMLRYPGKVAVDGDRIAVADSGHHRVLLGRLSADGFRMRVELTVGGTRGFRDGAASDARLDTPQGLAFAGDTLLVADAENHAVRAVTIGDGRVRTLAGTGAQLRTQADLAAGALSSPWDLAVAGGRVFIAMAGIHQLWSVALDGTGLRVHSGNRSEAIVDGPHADAALAQPMGIVSGPASPASPASVRDAGHDRLWFVDAESSAVRWADVDPRGAVGTIVGTGLFDFGDRDGVGDEVLMQHQQGLALADDGRLLVADSYNDALKWVDPRTRAAETWIRGLHEPSGLALTAERVYVADTNAHRVVVIDRATGRVGELETSDERRASSV